MSQTTVIGEHLEDYRSFFDHRWANRVYGRTKGTKLRRPFFDLATAWKSAANTFRMPSLMVDSLCLQHNSFHKEPPPAARMADGLTRYVARHMEGKLSADTLAELNSILRSAALEMREVVARHRSDMDPNEVWGEFHQHDEFRMALLGAQQIVFPSIYFAYEDFLLRTFKVVARRHQYRIRTEEGFAEDLKRYLGQTAANDCWLHPELHLARLVRHAIVHNGCRLTTDLKKLPNFKLAVQGEYIQIPPSYVKGLFEFLKVRAERLVTIALNRMEPRAAE